MTNLTEYGDLVLNGIDEWGRRRIDGLLEDGTKIIIIGAPPPLSQTLTDTLAFTDSIGLLSKFTRSIIDDLAIADQQIRRFTKKLSDAISVAEDFVKEILKKLKYAIRRVFWIAIGTG